MAVGVVAVVAICWGSWAWASGKKGRRRPVQEDGVVYEDSALPTMGGKPLIASEIDHVALEAVKTLQTDGKLSWTFRVPKLLSENLLPEQLSNMCVSAHETAAEMHAMANGHGAHKTTGHFHHPYYWKDDLFADPADEESLGPEYCEKSITYLLHEEDTRIGNSLMGMWLVYAMAEREGRAFFLDDSRWAYGRFDTYFKAPPAPKCKAPPTHLLLPCPRTTRHLIIAASTHSINFGHSFEDTFEDASKMETARKINIFGLLRIGYEALFHPNDHLSSLANKRAAAIEAASPESPVALIHIRQGDLRPYTFAYRYSYLPVSTYSSAIPAIFQTTTNEAKPFSMFIMSDSTLQTAIPMLQNDHVPPSFHPEDYPWLIDENSPSGMEVFLPGFYADTVRDMPSEEREKWAKSFVLDLAVARELLDQSLEGELERDAVVACGLRSAACRILGIMVGWEDTLAESRWKNVDGDWGWRGMQW